MPPTPLRHRRCGHARMLRLTSQTRGKGVAATFKDLWQLTGAVCGELSDRQTHRTATLVLPTSQRMFSGRVRTLTDGQADMRHTVESVSTRRIRWCQSPLHCADSVARKLAAVNTSPFDSPAFLPHVTCCKCFVSNQEEHINDRSLHSVSRNCDKNPCGQKMN